MPSFLLENGRLFLANAPRDSAVPAEFVALGAVEANGRLGLDADFPTAPGTPGDVLAGFRGDLVLTQPTQAAAIQVAVDRLRSQMNAVAPAGTSVELDETGEGIWVRISAVVHEIVGYVYDDSGAALRHWAYDYPGKPFRSFLCFGFTLRQVAASP